MIRIEVVYALREEQVLVALDVPAGATAWDAVERSGIARHFPGIDRDTAVIGIFGRVVEPATPLREGDRVEIYRPLAADPREARRHKHGRAGRARSGDKSRA